MLIEIKQPPNLGDKRDVLKFAWTPTIVVRPITNRRFIALFNKYHEEQVYSPEGWKTILCWIA